MMQQGKVISSHEAEVNERNEKLLDALCNGASNGNLDYIKYVISRGADVNQERNIGSTALHCAALHGHLDVIKYLVSQGAQVNRGDTNCNNGWSVLHSAVQKGHLDVTKYLISQGAEVNKVMRNGRTTLHSAVNFGNLDVIKYLISQGAEVNQGDNKGLAALHIAAECGRLDVTKYLTSQGADVNQSIHDGETALQLAAKNGHNDITIYLISRGAEHDANDPVYKHLAVQHCGTSIIEKLVSEGADLNILSTDGQACLHRAIQLCYKTDRNVEETDTLGKISEEIFQGKLSLEKTLVSYLLENGAKSDVKDKSGNLPIHYDKEDVVKQMIKLSSCAEPVKDDLLEGLAKHVPHTHYFQLGLKLLPEEYDRVGNTLVKNRNDYSKATQEALGMWKDRTGGHSFELWRILEQVELGGLWYHLSAKDPSTSQTTSSYQENSSSN